MVVRFFIIIQHLFSLSMAKRGAVLPNFFDLILSFFQLFDALVDARERFGPAEDMADLHGAAGRHGLAGNGDAHRPHDEGVFAAEFRRRADQTVVHGLLRPVGDGRETRAHLFEHIERDGLVALGLLVDIERGVVLGQRIEEAELFGNVRELFGALLQNGGDEGAAGESGGPYLLCCPESGARPVLTADSDAVRARTFDVCIGG